MAKPIGAACFKGVPDRRCLEAYCACAFEVETTRQKRDAASWRCKVGLNLPGDWEMVVRLTAELEDS